MPPVHADQGQLMGVGSAVVIALWWALLVSAALATLIAPVETHGPAASTPRPIRSSYKWIADEPRWLMLRGGADLNERSLQMRVVRDSVKVLAPSAVNPALNNYR